MILAFKERPNFARSICPPLQRQATTEYDLLYFSELIGSLWAN